MEVALIESTDNPETVICKAARNDYMGRFIGDVEFSEAMAEIDGENLKQKKKTLIKHLLDHGHFGPFEHPQATFAIKGVSRSCMGQLTRHRHASFDVQSMRYVPFDDVDPEPGEGVVTIPDLDTVSPTGRNTDADKEYIETTPDEKILEDRKKIYADSIEQAFSAYKELLKTGVPPENARMVLPIGTKVNIVVSMNARMLMHVADMRAAADAQWEIRNMTEDILSLAAEWCPITFEHYEEEMKNRKNRLAP
jgi:thymidylate synthase (FAD)